MSLKPRVNFLPNPPIINGELGSLDNLPLRHFNVRIRGSPFIRKLKGSYRLAYGTDFFYIFIEIDSEDVIHRDRGFQNGDGFHMLLAMPKPKNKLTDEFYVYGFSPQTDSDGNEEKVVWYHDVDVKLIRLGENVQFKVKRMQNGKTGYELLLPWEEAYPYHSWMVPKSMGFNLSFVKAAGSFFDSYSVIFDWRFQAEGKLRKYAIMTFEEPIISNGTQTHITSDRNCIEGTDLTIKVATLSAQSHEEVLEIEFLSTKNEQIKNVKKFRYECHKGVTQKQIKVPMNGFSLGSYIIQWKTHSDQGKIEVTILPKFNYEELCIQLKNSRGEISEGTFITLQFMLDQIHKEIKQIKTYETYPELIDSILEVQNMIQNTENEVNMLETQTGGFRRAFLSEIDGSMQPYSVVIPESYDPTQKYPLIVFLHGSGVDDRGTLRLIDFVIGEYIKIAPRARGYSHYYAPKETLIDIKEAIDDIIKQYSVDTERIILSGFSMGGYGVYRTYKEYPRFAGLAVFSGQPKVPWYIRLFTKGKFVNFLKKKHVKLFRQIPMFIYHGTEDKNCSYESTVEFVEKLRKLGGNVEFYDDNVGHSKLESPEIIAKYNNWLQKTIG